MTRANQGYTSQLPPLDPALAPTLPSLPSSSHDSKRNSNPDNLPPPSGASPNGEGHPTIAFAAEHSHGAYDEDEESGVNRSLEEEQGTMDVLKRRIGMVGHRLWRVFVISSAIMGITIFVV